MDQTPATVPYNMDNTRDALDSRLLESFTVGQPVQISAPFLGAAFGIMHVMSQILRVTYEGRENATIELASGETMTVKNALDVCDSILELADGNLDVWGE